MKVFYLSLLLFFCMSVHGQNSSVVLLDNFNRNDSVKVGVPAGSTYEYWLEHGEVWCPSAIRLKTNAFEMSKYSTSGSSCFGTARAANIDMQYKYSTIIANAPGQLEWYFNMRQNTADPTGFGTGQTGAAFVVGCTTSDPTSAPTGYAVAFGDATSTDRVRLVRFQSGFNSGTITDIISIPGPANNNNYMSIRVTYNPCNNQWTLKMRDDGATAFADPSTLMAASTTAETAINSTHTSLNLPWIGGIWVSSGNGIVRYDNVYIPASAGASGTYTWNGSASTNYQTATNWTPTRTCIKTTDILQFTAASPASSVVTNVPTQTIGKLVVSGNRTVTFKDVEDAAVSTLTINGSTDTDLDVESGSTLALDVSSSNAQDAINVQVGTGATGNISGTVKFTNTTVSGANPHRLTATDANAITVNSGGVINAEFLFGNPFGNTGNNNTIIFNNGATYINSSGSDPFALTAPNSKVLFNRGSNYRHLSTTQPSFSGRTYANVEVNANTSVLSGSSSSTNIDHLSVTGGSFQITGVSNSLAVNLNIKGNLSVSTGATFNYSPVTASTLSFNSDYTSQQLTTTGNLTFGRNLTVKLNSNYATPQLTISNDITVAGALHIQLGTLHINSNVTLPSDQTSTASVNEITGAITYGSGRFIVERYIPAHKAWQFLATPTSGQTINEAWQEGNLPLVNAKPGYGTIITGDVIGNGFDIYTPAGASMKIFNSINNSWTSIPNTSSLIANQKGYMLLVRGDRSVTTHNGAPTITTLRTSGKLYSPNELPPVTTVTAQKFESIGNPYASAIDFNQVTRTGEVQNIFYTWDPYLTGVYALGAFQTFSYNPISGTYDVAPGQGSSANNRYIQSGQAFMVSALPVGTSGGTVTFTETTKETGSALVTRGDKEKTRQIRADLYVAGANSVLVDGTLIQFDHSFSDDLDMLDAWKMNNSGENLSISNNNHRIAIERRNTVGRSDTIHYHLSGLRQQAYQLVITPDNWQRGLQAYMIDSYLNTITEVDLQEPTRITFNITNDPNAADAGRFKLVFSRQAPPISLSESGFTGF